MSKRITLTKNEIKIIELMAKYVMGQQRANYALDKVGQYSIATLLRKLGVPYDATKRNEP